MNERVARIADRVRGSVACDRLGEVRGRVNRGMWGTARGLENETARAPWV